MKGDTIRNLETGDTGTIKIYGNKYRGLIIGLGKKRVTISFEKRCGDGETERTVPVVWDPFRFEAAHSACFLPRQEIRDHQRGCPPPPADGPTWGIWCRRSSASVFGSGEGWAKHEDKVIITTEQAAREEAARLTGQTRSPNVRFEAREFETWS